MSFRKRGRLPHLGANTETYVLQLVREYDLCQTDAQRTVLAREINRVRNYVVHTSYQGELSRQAALAVVLRLTGTPEAPASLNSRATHTPPRLAKLVLLLIPLRNRDGIMGDLEEEFHAILVPEYGLRVAKFYYWWHVVLACLNALKGLALDVTQLIRRLQ